MDVIQGNDVKGSIDGTTKGGASLVPGKHGSALSLNGNDGRVHYGVNVGECFHFPGMCSTGSTYAYWLRYRAPRKEAVILDTGGLYVDTQGYAVIVMKKGALELEASDSTGHYFLSAHIGNPDHWLFIVHTWSPSSGFNLYLNGCILGDAYADKIRRVRGITASLRFTIGEDADIGADRANMDLDNLLAWDEELAAAEVWQLYVQAGQVDTSDWQRH